VLTPIVLELRREAGLPGFESRAVMAGEFEIVSNLHGALTFLRIRRDIYKAPMPIDMPAAIRLHIDVFLPGALLQMQALHQSQSSSTLTAPPPTL
jgi:hypothetical protein